MVVKLSTSAKKIVMKRCSTPGAIGWPESIRLRTIPMGANIANDRSALASSLVACCSSAISRIRDRDGICSPNDKERMRLIVSGNHLDRVRYAPSHDVYERALDHHQRHHEPDQQPIGALELADEIGRRCHDQDLPGLP